MSNSIERRSIVQTMKTVKGVGLWYDGIGGHDVEAGKHVLGDLRKMYPRERYRLVQIVTESDEVLA